MKSNTTTWDVSLPSTLYTHLITCYTINTRCYLPITINLTKTKVRSPSMPTQRNSNTGYNGCNHFYIMYIYTWLGWADLFTFFLMINISNVSISFTEQSNSVCITCMVLGALNFLTNI